MKVLISACQDGCCFPVIGGGKEKLQQAILISLFEKKILVWFFRFEFKLLEYFSNSERLS